MSEDGAATGGKSRAEWKAARSAVMKMEARRELLLLPTNEE